eukprot:CAMPEP_0174348752 /NCGR_PEP_ID=MMETSP0811_2-20130205/5317_1 /TAXON_ID=73025 ORGANISM="Eutreptiella gymnastica-like, Strain CCMP1594" /NCGR_SAMPLE_ID=MMETSP0811_2 /ASSEMBLY_ACC=CAM_ASM_000667 /LENGTH=38 /DNA_ID= /DNA_START= /DNA_END= /DNA_ORIENTATION=
MNHENRKGMGTLPDSGTRNGATIRTMVNPTSCKRNTNC